MRSRMLASPDTPRSIKQDVVGRLVGEEEGHQLRRRVRIGRGRRHRKQHRRLQILARLPVLLVRDHRDAQLLGHELLVRDELVGVDEIEERVPGDEHRLFHLAVRRRLRLQIGRRRQPVFLHLEPEGEDSRRDPRGRSRAGLRRCRAPCRAGAPRSRAAARSSPCSAEKYMPSGSLPFTSLPIATKSSIVHFVGSGSVTPSLFRTA